jgi:hypothetical protein
MVLFTAVQPVKSTKAVVIKIIVLRCIIVIVWLKIRKIKVRKNNAGHPVKKIIFSIFYFNDMILLGYGTKMPWR